MAESDSSSLRERRPLADRLMLVLARAHARRVLDRFMQAVRNAKTVQQHVLFEKIRRNAASDYGRAHGFSNIRTYQDFTRQVPISTYEHLEPYIEKVKAGEIGAMFGPRQRVHMFAKTSGTTDRPKYVPVTTPFLREYRRGWNAFGVKVITDHPGTILRPIVQVSSPMDEETSSGGFPCGAITGLMAATQKRLVRRYYVVPLEVAYIAEAAARYYTIMRFAITRDVAFLITASPATQLRLARVADQSAESLIRDVRNGTIDPARDIPADLRRRLEARLSPRPDVARRLDVIRERTGRLLPKDFWQLGFLANWTGGTMGLYLRDFPEYFGEVPVRDIGLIASEGRMSIPVADGTPAGLLNIPDNFYEFIPAEEYGRESPTTLRSHEVEVDKEYFILLTTSAGFYRYDLGDRVRVAGFEHETPLIEFLHKGVHACSLTGEKLTEQQVVMAFDALNPPAPATGQTFVLAPQWETPPFYRLHLEAPTMGEAALRQLAERYDCELQRINIEYASKRESGRLGSIRVNPVPVGWMAERDRRIAARQRASNEQYKHRFLLSEVDADRDFPVANRTGT